MSINNPLPNYLDKPLPEHLVNPQHFVLDRKYATVNLDPIAVSNFFRLTKPKNGITNSENISIVLNGYFIDYLNDYLQEKKFNFHFLDVDPVQINLSFRKFNDQFDLERTKKVLEKFILVNAGFLTENDDSQQEKKIKKDYLIGRFDARFEERIKMPFLDGKYRGGITKKNKKRKQKTRSKK